MTSRRELLIVLGAGAISAPLASSAQQPAKTFRIGYLGSTTASGFANQVEALRAGLRDFGYVEGKNIVIEYRWAEGKYERLPELAAELVRLKVDVLVTHGIQGALPAKRATTTIPIVLAMSADAVAGGVVASLARPGGNVTGSTYFAPQLAAKRLELLKEAVPRVTRVAVLLNSDHPDADKQFQAMKTAARSLKLELQRFEARGPNEFSGAFAAIAKRGIDAVAIHQDGAFIGNAKGIADLALKHRLLSVGFNEFAEAGGLIGYAQNTLEMFRRAAYFVDRILKGAKPGDLPVEQPTKFELVVNLKTAKALGIKIPNSILLRADKVIE